MVKTMCTRRFILLLLVVLACNYIHAPAFVYRKHVQFQKINRKLFTSTMPVNHEAKPTSLSPFEEDNAVYDVETIEKFYKEHKNLVYSRMMKIISMCSGFNMKLVMDWKSGKLDKNMQHRAEEATKLIGQLGPTFVKLGQSLSIRTDIIPPEYAQEMKKLQDAVPPFDTNLAKEIICREIGINDLSDKFKEFPDKPIASASIGQVYKATLWDGRKVAVKVQRPDILSSIGLDLHILRKIVPLQVRVTNMVNGGDSTSESKDLDLGYSLVDEWGRGLVAEVDYLQEARNTMQFIEAMKKRGLHAVTSPGVIEELSTSRILVTEWIDGTRLDRDSSADIPRLCGLALNAYLTMLLDTGVLHCDPHPGNLLRTTDGKLCILDWGMTLTLPKDLQYGLLEFISHVNAGDFNELPNDFVKLGATPADKVEDVKKSGIPEGFAFIMKQLSKGGGPSKITDNLRDEFKSRYGDLSDLELTRKAADDMVIQRETRGSSSSSSSGSGGGSSSDNSGGDISGVTGLMEMMSKKNRDIFKLPTYMLYVVRAFSTLEGIGLSIDPSYSILQECYPYLAKRLMTDDNPRSRAALKNMIFKEGVLKTDKLIEFSAGFTSYTASTIDVDRDGAGIQKAQEALTELLLDSKGNMMQDLVLEGTAKMIDSLFRVGFNRMKVSPGGKLIELALKTPKAMVDILVPNELKPFLLPFTLPYDLSKALINLVEKDETDNENVKSLKILWKNLEPRLRQELKTIASKGLPVPRGSSSSNSGSGGSSSTTAEQVRELFIPMSLIDSKIIRQQLKNTKKINDRIPIFIKLTRKLSASMLNQASDRMATIANNVPHDKATSTVDGAHHDDFDYEVELLITEQVGTFSSATIKNIANVIDQRPPSQV